MNTKCALFLFEINFVPRDIPISPSTAKIVSILWFLIECLLLIVCIRKMVWIGLSITKDVSRKDLVNESNLLLYRCLAGCWLIIPFSCDLPRLGRYLRSPIVQFNERMMLNAMKNLRKKTEFEMKREYTANARTLLNHRGVHLNDDVISCINEAAFPYSVSRSGSAKGQGPSSWKIIPKEDAMIVRVCAVFRSFDVI